MTNKTSRYFVIALLLAAPGLAACNPAEPDKPAQAAPAYTEPPAPLPSAQEAAPAPAAAMPAAEPRLMTFSEAEARGKVIYLRCAACHSVKAADGNKVGPHLEGILERKAGSVEGYNYSEQLRETDLVWTEEMLDQFIAEPRSVFTRTSMVFAGIQKEDDRAALMAYLKTF